MSTCCNTAGGPKTAGWTAKVRSAAKWILPSAGIALVPKCPACLAAYVALWTGLGLSLAVATYLRYGLLLVCGGCLIALVVQRVIRFRQRYFT